MKMTSKEIIVQKFDKVIEEVNNSLNNVKRFAIAEAWKILQLVTANVIQTIELIGNDLAGSQKKELALQLLNKFYDTTFVVVDIPFVPSLMESLLHKYVKALLMILVSATIDSMVTIFRNTGIFLKKQQTGE